MSLINDALRKAQKQRTGEAPPLASLPGIGGESAHRIAKRAKPAGFNVLLVRLGLGAGALLVVVIGAWFMLGRKPETRNLKPEVSAHQTPAIGAAATPPQAVVDPQLSGLRSQASEPAPTFNLPIAAHATPPPAIEKQTPATPATTTPQVSPSSVASAKGESFKPQVSEPAQTIQAPAPPPAKMDGRSVTYIENLRIAGIRASATDAKVLMNDRVYRNGDMVEHELGLRLVGITSSSLTFENEQGARYTRNF